MIAPILSTDRLTLRPYRLSDFQRLAEIYESPRSHYIGGLRSRDKAWRDFASDVGQWVLLGFGGWAIEERSSGAYVGIVGLNFPVEFPERELGWILWEEFEGKGYAFEAALPVIMRLLSSSLIRWSAISIRIINVQSG